MLLNDLKNKHLQLAQHPFDKSTLLWTPQSMSDVQTWKSVQKLTEYDQVPSHFLQL
jgi:hypothetical protein